jgi:hypothetical protein
MAQVEHVRNYQSPGKICDLVLKGGVTSGVVYPLALATLAEEYRFSRIGGTSAGAIAAAAAAAAEYGRYSKAGGFERLGRIPDEVGRNLLSMFQPIPVLKPLFDIFVAILKSETLIGRARAIILTAVKGCWGAALLGLLPGLFIAAAALAFDGSVGFSAFGLLVALVGFVVATLMRLLKTANVALVKNDFGLCTGIRQPYASCEAFADWLTRLIDEAAGRADNADRPLTFGDLAAPPRRPTTDSIGYDDNQSDGAATLHIAHE